MFMKVLKLIKKKAKFFQKHISLVSLLLVLPWKEQLLLAGQRLFYTKGIGAQVSRYGVPSSGR